MNLFLHYPIIVLCIVCIESAKLPPNLKCTKEMRMQIDQQFGSLFPIVNKVKLPENKIELDGYCKSMLSATDLFIDYVKSCNGVFGPYMAKITANNMKTKFESICKSGQGDLNKKMFKVSQCVNQAVNNGLDKCNSNALDTMMAVQSASDKDRINMICCHARKYVACIQDTVSKTNSCDKDLTTNPENYGLISIQGSMEEMCGEYYTNNTKCDALVAKTPKISAQSYQPKSFFIPTLELLDSYRTIECNEKSDQRMDKNVAEMLTIGTSDPFPENFVQLRQWCNKIMQQVPFNYGYMESCYSDYGKRIIRVGVSQAQNNLDSFCSPSMAKYFEQPSTEVQKMLELAKCFNKAESKVVICLNKLIDRVMSAVKAPVDDRTAMSCCATSALKACIVNATSATPGCSKETIEWADSMLTEYSKPSIEMVCGEHFGSDQCPTLLANIPKLNPKTYVRPRSLFMPYLNLINSFPNKNF